MTAVSTCQLPATRGALVGTPAPLGCAVALPAEGACRTVTSSSLAVIPARVSGHAALSADGNFPPALRMLRCLQLRRTITPFQGGTMSNVRRATDGQPRLRPLVEGGGGPAGAAPALAAGDLRLGSWAPRIPSTGTTGKRPKTCAKVEMIVAKETGSNVPTDPTAEGTEPKLKSVLLRGSSRNIFSPGPLEEVDRSYSQIICSDRPSQPCWAPGLWPVRASGTGWSFRLSSSPPASLLSSCKLLRGKKVSSRSETDDRRPGPPPCLFWKFTIINYKCNNIFYKYICIYLNLGND